MELSQTPPSPGKFMSLSASPLYIYKIFLADGCED